MPYYLVIKERPTGMLWDRPISFVEKLAFGSREFGIVGPKPLVVDVISHNQAWVTALRAVEIAMKYHGRETGFVELTKAVAVVDPNPGRVCIVNMQKGQRVLLDQSSMCVLGKPDEQVRWSESMDGCGDDYFGDLCLAAINTVNHAVG